MKLDEAKAVFDFITRHQLYLEGVKNWYARDFVRYVKLMRDKLVSLIRSTSVDRIGELSKRAFMGLLRKLDKATADGLGAWVTEFSTEFRRFVRIDTGVQRAGFAAKSGKDVSAPSIGDVWKEARDGIVPAFGSTVVERTRGIVQNARAAVQRVVKRGYADNLTPDETVAEVIGEDTAQNYKGGTLAGIVNEGKGIITTAIQAGAAFVGTVMQKIVSGCYIWNSIIDGVTSDICRRRNGEVYRWGEGPVPPAHPHCRSRTAPWPCGEKGEPPTFNKWIRSQPRGLLRDVYGDDVEKLLDNEGDDAANFLKGKLAKALTLDEFELKTSAMVN